MSFAKAGDLNGINKVEEFKVEVLNKLLEISVEFCLPRRDYLA